MLTKVTTISNRLDPKINYVGVYLRNGESYLEAEYLCHIDHMLFLRKAFSSNSRMKKIFELLAGCFEYGSNLNESIGKELYYGLSDSIRAIIMNIYGKPSIVTAYDRHPQKLYLDWSKPEQRNVVGLQPTNVTLLLNPSINKKNIGFFFENTRYAFTAQFITCADNILLIRKTNSYVPPKVVFELLSGCFEHSSNFAKELRKIPQARAMEGIDGIAMNLYGFLILVTRNNRHPESLRANWERQYELAGSKICYFKS